MMVMVDWLVKDDGILNGNSGESNWALTNTKFSYDDYGVDGRLERDNVLIGDGLGDTDDCYIRKLCDWNGHSVFVTSLIESFNIKGSSF